MPNNPPVSDRDDLYQNWMGWVIDHLGRDAKLAEIAASAATDSARAGRGFNHAAEAAREAWTEAASRYTNAPTAGVAAAGPRSRWIFGIAAVIALVVAVGGWDYLFGGSPTDVAGGSVANESSTPHPSEADPYPPTEPFGDGGVTYMFTLGDHGQSRTVLWNDLGTGACPSRSVGIREPADVSEPQLAADLMHMSLMVGVIQNACGGGDVYGYAPGTGPRGPYTMGDLAVPPFLHIESDICCHGRNVVFTAGSESHPGNSWVVVIGPQPGDGA
jgi:hypothetical protein